MELTSATGSLKNDLMCEQSMVDIRIVTESDLMCEELIIDVPLVMEPDQWPKCCIYCWALWSLVCLIWFDDLTRPE